MKIIVLQDVAQCSLEESDRRFSGGHCLLRVTRKHVAGILRLQMCTQFWLEIQKKKTLEKPGHKWKDNIKINAREIGFGM